MARHFHHEHGKKHSKSHAHMIAEDHGAPCLLPTGVVDKYYEKHEEGQPSHHLADLSTGVEMQMKEDREDMKRVFKPSKY